jgi:uncharacterized RDD family membrane protein YckC
VVRAALLLAIGVAAALGGAIGDEGLQGVGMGLMLVTAFFLEWGYFVVLEVAMNGQSVGKRALRLRVVTSDGRPLSFTQSVLRNLLRAADFLPLLYALGVLIVARDRLFRRLGDMVAGTLVLVEERNKIHAPLVVSPLPTLHELYEIPQRPNLSPKELDAVERFLRRVGQHAPARELELAEMIAPTLAQRLGTQYRDPVRFLSLLHYRSTHKGAHADAR